MLVTRGDVVTVAAPRDNPLPAVVLQSNRIGTATALIVPITSELTNAAPIRIPLKPSESNGLRATSELMVDKLFAVARIRIGSRIGRLEPETMRQLETAVLLILGFGDDA